MAAEAVAGVAIFPNFSAEQRGKGFTDFNDLGTLNPEIVSRQLDEVLQGLREQRLVANCGCFADSNCWQGIKLFVASYGMLMFRGHGIQLPRRGMVKGLTRGEL
jgi:hypothetical protein